MAQIVPLNKRSKKAQKEYHTKQRGSWYGISPVTRTVPSGKVYDRNRVKREDCRALEKLWRRVSLQAIYRQTVSPQERTGKVRPATGDYPERTLRSPPELCGLGLWGQNPSAHRQVHQISQEQQVSTLAQAGEQ